MKGTQAIGNVCHAPHVFLPGIMAGKNAFISIELYNEEGEMVAYEIDIKR